MRAAFIERPGPAGEIRYGDLPAPRPGPTDVLVDVIATTVNHVDTFVRSGAYPTPSTAGGPGPPRCLTTGTPT